MCARRRRSAVAEMRLHVNATRVRRRSEPRCPDAYRGASPRASHARSRRRSTTPRGSDEREPELRARKKRTFSAFGRPITTRSHATARARSSVQISLCMIVKNEQRVLPALLEEVRDFFDEIIVVDNGSTDRTREILSHFDVITIVRENAEEHPYEADLRNAGIALATNPWVLILDADERVSREGLARLRDMEPEAGTDGYFLRWDTYSGGEVIEDYKLALIRSDARFVGAVHANVQPHFRRHHRLARGSNALRIEHRPDPSRLAAKALLRERALRRALKDDPDNVRCLWFLGYGRLGQNRLE